MNKTAGQLIRAWRRRTGITQSAVARACGVSIQTVWYWEHGIKRPGRDNCERLAEISRGKLSREALMFT